MASTQAPHSELGIQNREAASRNHRIWQRWSHLIKNSKQSFPIPDLRSNHLTRLIKAEWLVISLLFTWSSFLLLSALN
ncbi:MAG: hypothetical protein MK185_04495 [Saccharospirillaceae bacterium]|nr:hypothetical protein A3759_22820 [Thalassolituus sp. HI0120]KZZ50639.1 hypothetical protein A3759_16715 [Thalassolituus sp. HI0120]MCH2039870.1 hypothetical protein [Saccharospirillaceae bacterium]